MYFLEKNIPQETREMLIEAAEKKGLKVCKLFKQFPMRWDFALAQDDYHTNDILGSHYDGKNRKHILVTPGSMFDMIMKYPLTQTIQLTDEYEAVIDKSNKIVKVGCQRIPFEKVNGLFH